MRRYPIYYSGSNNFGDAINPVLYKSITGENPEWVEPGRFGKIVACGSLAHEVLPDDIVWGTGCMFEDTKLKCGVSTQVRLLRGPLSADIFRNYTYVPNLYGDPGLLLPKYIPPSPKSQKIGIIPHYTDRDIVQGDSGLRDYFIDIMAGVSEVIKRVTSCDYIISSALHGIICAEAYGIPAIWVEFSDNVAGQGFKFRDYYYGTDRQPPPPLNWKYFRTLSTATERLKHWQPPKVDADAMLRACPFNWRMTDYDRWENLDGTWQDRNAKIATMIDAGSNIIEFGAGTQPLRNLLKSCEYTPSDIIRRTSDTVVCDLNTNFYPNLLGYDTIVMSGVIEYINDFEPFINYVGKNENIKTFICSYEGELSEINGWVNPISKDDLINLFSRNGFEVSLHDGLYKFTRARQATKP